MPSLVLSEVEQVEHRAVTSKSPGLGQIFLQQVHQRPSSTAIVNGDKSITYAQLHVRAAEIATKLCRRPNFQLETPVAILVGFGINDILAQIAVIYAGGTCVPLDPSIPDALLLEQRLSGAAVDCVLVDKKHKDRLPSLPKTLIEDHESTKNDVFLDNFVPVSTSPSHRTHLLFTSGSTGRPKPVQILAKSMIHVLHHSPWSPLPSTSVIAHHLSTSFDVSNFGTWIPMLRGATSCCIHRDVTLDPVALREALRKYHVTGIIMTSSLFNLTAFACPDTFAQLETLMIGGEVVNKKAIKAVFENGSPRHFYNVYGPTEAFMYSTVYEMSMNDMATDRPMPIGVGMGETQVFVLDEHLKPVDDEEIGELFLGGVGISRGYLNRPENNAKSFLNVSGLTHSGSALRLYKTGDLVCRQKSGIIEYIGRNDLQVKIRGHRIELESVEVALLKTRLFSAAAAIKINSLEDGAGAVLVAFVIPDPSKKDELNKAAELLKQLLPAYHIPRIQVVENLPLNMNGKVDRKKLEQQYLAEMQSRPKPKNLEDMNTISRLEQIWYDVLALPQARIAPYEDFFLLGGTSLQAPALISKIRQIFDVEITTTNLYENSTLFALAECIDNIKSGNAILNDEKEAWLRDSQMAEGLKPVAGPLPNWRSEKGGQILLTGVTGFIGAFFLHDLLKLPEVDRVACLIRAGDAKAGLARIQKSLEKYDLWDDSFIPKVWPVVGDLAKEQLGLSKKIYNEIGNWANVIFHLGAHVNYCQPYSTHRAANVVGTLNILKLMTFGRPKVLHYSSSIAAFGPTGQVNGVSVVAEDESLLDHINAMQFDQGYSQSQWVAEQMLWNAISQGFGVTIYRPGFVMGHSVTGVNNPADFLSRLMVECIKVGSYPDLPNQRKEFIPVDFVVSAILHISSSNQNIGHAHNIIPVDHTRSTDMNEVFVILEKLGVKLQSLPYAEWVKNLPDDDLDGLAPLFPLLEEKVFDTMTRWEMYGNMPIYEAKNTVRALESRPEPLECPFLEEKLLKKYLNHWEKRISAQKTAAA